MWQEEHCEGEVTSSTAGQSELLAFSSDLASLRKVAQHLKAAMPRVSATLFTLAP